MIKFLPISNKMSDVELGPISNGQNAKKAKIIPKGRILNDHHENKDHLGSHYYAQTLADCIQDVQTPITIGILSAWGSGKSFLLDSIKGKLLAKNMNSRSRLPDVSKKFLAYTLMITPIILLGINITMGCTIVEKKTTSNNEVLTSSTASTDCSNKHLIIATGTTGLILIVTLILVFFMSGIKGQRKKVLKPASQLGFSFGEKLKFLFVCWFTKIPYSKSFAIDDNPPQFIETDIFPVDPPDPVEVTESIEKDKKKIKRNFIHVDFNAWEYMGSEKIWVAIITKLIDEMEHHFGKKFCRLFRVLDLQFYHKKKENDKKQSLWLHFIKHRSYLLGVAIVDWILLFLVYIALIAIAVYYNQDMFQAPLAFWTSIILPSLGAISGALRLVWGLFNSQRRRIESALKGIRNDLAEELDFMQKVKYEVKMIEIFLKVVEFVLGEEYKIVITVDDLDRIPHTMIKSILDAMNLLLSDENSPFISIIAVDPRIAVKSIETELDLVLRRANVNGYEYMKKIINLPFCIPKIGDNEKRRLVRGLFVESDDVKEVDSLKDAVDAVTDETDAAPQEELETKEPVILTKKKFLHTCRSIIKKEHTNILSYVGSNPRAIKRLMNVISLTSHLINSLQEGPNAIKTTLQLTEEFAENLVFWIILCEVWPFRLSLILYVINHDLNSSLKKQKIESLSSIYEKDVKPIMHLIHVKGENEPSLLSLDGSPEHLQHFLRFIKKKKTQKDLKTLLKYTTNLDATIYDGIVIKKRLFDLREEKSTHDMVDNLKLLSDATFNINMKNATSISIQETNSVQDKKEPSKQEKPESVDAGDLLNNM